MALSAVSSKHEWLTVRPHAAQCLARGYAMAFRIGRADHTLRCDGETSAKDRLNDRDRLSGDMRRGRGGTSP